MPIKKLLLPFSLVSLLAASFSATAAIITIEPDDHEAGTDLTDISPYVTLERLSLTFPADPNLPYETHHSAVFATDTNHGPAPTGALSFGTYGYEGGGSLGRNVDDGFAGFGMFFGQQTERVSIMATTWYPGLNARWAAFDQAGNAIAYGFETPVHEYGDPFSLNIEVEGMWALVLGGNVGTAAYEFDQLAFEIDDVVSVSAVSVPEPNALPLLAMGMGILVLAAAARRRKQ